MKILFCIHDFQEKNYRLQPWLNFYRIGKIFASSGHQVSVLTDYPVSEKISGINIYSVKSLQGKNSNQICRVIKNISPDVALFSVTPLSLVTSRWISKIKGIKFYAFLSYSFYNFTEISKAFIHLNQKDKLAYGRHLIVPKLAWKYVLSKYFEGVFCQSNRTGNRINKNRNKNIPVYSIPPGIDKTIWFPRVKKDHKLDETVFLYMGSPKRIRGFDLILKAFSLLPFENVKLKILARGACDRTVEGINLRLQDLDIESRTQVFGDWLSLDRVQQHITDADVALLPFVLVPSELPVTVMEAIACGTPVIVSDIDGLPEAAGNCGMVVSQADVKSLAEAMTQFHIDISLRETMQSHCLETYESMFSWENVAENWMKAFEITY